MTCCCSIRICLPSTSFSSSSFRSWKFLRSRVRRAEILLFSRLQAGAQALCETPLVNPRLLICGSSYKSSVACCCSYIRVSLLIPFLQLQQQEHPALLWVKQGWQHACAPMVADSPLVTHD